MRKAPYNFTARHTQEMLQGIENIAARVKSGFYTGMAATLVDRHNQLHEAVLGRARTEQRMIAGAGAHRLANLLLHPDDYELPSVSDDDRRAG